MAEMRRRSLVKNRPFVAQDQEIQQQVSEEEGASAVSRTDSKFAGATEKVRMERKTSITSVPLGSQSASGASGDSDETKVRTLSTSILVPGRITDTEIRLKMTGDLALWYCQEKPRILKYTKHMLHFFFTGVCALVGKTHIYFLKTLGAEQGERRKHIKVKYSQVLFVKLPAAEKKGGKKDNLTYYSEDEGEVTIKTGNKGETHVLIDHFALQKKQPSSCQCADPGLPCKCLKEARRLICQDPQTYQQFTGTTNFLSCCRLSAF